MGTSRKGYLRKYLKLPIKTNDFILGRRKLLDPYKISGKLINVDCRFRRVMSLVA